MDPSCLVRVRAAFHIELHPSKLHDVETGVREHLNAMLFKYQDDLESFVMAYEGVKIATANANIHPYFPLVHVEARANVLLFKPAVGSVLVGRVFKVASDFIGLLVLGVFNASIAADAVGKDYKLKPGADKCSHRKDPSLDIEVGSDVRFQVVKLQEQAAFFGIHGALVKGDSSIVRAHDAGAGVGMTAVAAGTPEVCGKAGKKAHAASDLPSTSEAADGGTKRRRGADAGHLNGDAGSAKAKKSKHKTNDEGKQKSGSDKKDAKAEKKDKEKKKKKSKKESADK